VLRSLTILLRTGCGVRMPGGVPLAVLIRCRGRCSIPSCWISWRMTCLPYSKEDEVFFSCFARRASARGARLSHSSGDCSCCSESNLGEVGNGLTGRFSFYRWKIRHRSPIHAVFQWSTDTYGTKTRRGRLISPPSMTFQGKNTEFGMSGCVPIDNFGLPKRALMCPPLWVPSFYIEALLFAL
jgi:hypothetical protein